MFNLYNLKPHSWLKHTYEVTGDGLHFALQDFAKKLTVPLSETFRAHELCDAALNDARTYGLSTDQFMQAFKQSAEKRFGNLEIQPDHLAHLVEGQDNVFSLKAAKEHLTPKVAPAEIDLNKISIHDVLAEHAILHPLQAAGKNNFMQQVKKLTTQEKIYAGTWLGGAALGGVSLYGAATNMMYKDADGNNHMQWSNVGIAVIQAALTAACLYMSLQIVQGHSVS